jgi:hypothetical protein
MSEPLTATMRPPTDVVERFSIVTPANWVVVDLDPRTRDRSARRMVKRSVGAADELARLRQEAVVAYRHFAADAADKGAFLALMVSELIGDTPMFASLLAFVTPPVTAADGSSLTTVDEMAPALRAPVEGERLVAAGPVDLRLGPAFRTRAVVGSGLHGSDGAEADTDVVRYVVPMGGLPNLLVLAFSTPIVSLGDDFARLFDQMARTAQWRPLDERPAS